MNKVYRKGKQRIHNGIYVDGLLKFLGYDTVTAGVMILIYLLTAIRLLPGGRTYLQANNT
jgi:hypothetical protein